MPEQKASTPWSTRTVSEGGTDSPVGDLVPIPDKITPVVNTGFISLAGKYRGIPSDDLQFTFQDPSQALAAGADLDFPVNMLNHDMLILAALDSSGNAINAIAWKINKDTVGGTLRDILGDTSEDLAATWQFYKIINLRGTQIRIKIHNNEGADAGTISTAYLRLV